jgi:hypothetical protein
LARDWQGITDIKDVAWLQTKRIGRLLQHYGITWLKLDRPAHHNTIAQVIDLPV